MQKTNNLGEGLKELGRNIKFQWEKHGSQICTIGGTVALVGSGIHACRKTYKQYDFLKSNGEKIREAKKPIEGEKKVTRIFRVAKVSAVVCAKTAVKYIPEIAGTALGCYGVGKGWTIEHTHYKEAAAFGSMIFAEFMDYRKHVIAEHGEDTDKRYMTTKHIDGKVEVEAETEDGTKVIDSTDDGISLAIDPKCLRIWFGKGMTELWSPSYQLRITNLEYATNQIDKMLIDGHVSVNDIRRIFYGRKGDLPWGDIYGRIWEPGDPKHPERGKLTDLHYKEDEDFMLGRTDGCWLTIDIDPEPIITRMRKDLKDIRGVED